MALIEYLNKLGGANGIGLLDIVENRLVGMKSRGVYETPGGAILYKAHNVLETITLDKEAFHFKESVAQKMGELVYNGQWFTPLREALSAFTDDLQKTVTGDVTLKLYKGNMINAGVTSPYTLYDEQTASFGEDDDYNQADAERLHQPVWPAHCRARQAGPELAYAGLICPSAISTARRARAPLAVAFLYTVRADAAASAPACTLLTNKTSIGGTICRNFGRAAQARP